VEIRRTQRKGWTAHPHHRVDISRFLNLLTASSSLCNPSTGGRGHCRGLTAQDGRRHLESLLSRRSRGSVARQQLRRSARGSHKSRRSPLHASHQELRRNGRLRGGSLRLCQPLTAAAQLSRPMHGSGAIENQVRSGIGIQILPPARCGLERPAALRSSMICPPDSLIILCNKEMVDGR